MEGEAPPLRCQRGKEPPPSYLGPSAWGYEGLYPFKNKIKMRLGCDLKRGQTEEWEIYCVKMIHNRCVLALKHNNKNTLELHILHYLPSPLA